MARKLVESRLFDWKEVYPYIYEEIYLDVYEDETEDGLPGMLYIDERRELVDTRHRKRKNAENVRLMDNEKLSEFLSGITDCPTCPLKETCGGDDCKNEWIEWLEREADE